MSGSVCAYRRALKTPTSNPPEQSIIDTLRMQTRRANLPLESLALPTMIARETLHGRYKVEQKARSKQMQKQREALLRHQLHLHLHQLSSKMEAPTLPRPFQDQGMYVRPHHLRRQSRRTRTLTPTHRLPANRASRNIPSISGSITTLRSRRRALDTPHRPRPGNAPSLIPDIDRTRNLRRLLWRDLLKRKECSSALMFSILRSSLQK